MWEYLAVLFIGVWLGIAVFLYVSCYWVEEILDLPQVRDSALGRGSESVAASGAEGASGAHVQLKRLVQRVVEEAVALPELAHYAARDPAPRLHASTYEDLLASAILNKVIERYQTESGSGGRSSGIHSASASPTPSSRSSPGTRPRDSPPLRDEEEDDASDWDEGEATDEAPELPRRVPFPEFGGDIIHTTDNDERDFDEISSSDLQAVDGTWEENWLFQKKKIKTIQSVPVPMLVPNSNAEYRALIGDRDADDTTDLSDAASESEDDDEYKCDIKRTLDFKTVIGGKTSIGNLIMIESPETASNDEVDADSHVYNKLNSSEYINNSETQNHTETNGRSHNDRTDSIMVVGIDSGPLSKAEFAVENIHRTVLNGHSDELFTEDIVTQNSTTFTKKTVHDAINKDMKNSLTNHQKDGEYEEDIAVPVQRYADSLRRQHYPTTLSEDSRDTSLDFNKNLEDDLIPGSIAERERKKWLNYVDMPNNPYSAEAIKKRLSAKNTSAIFDMLTSPSSPSPSTEEEYKQNNEAINGDEVFEDKVKSNGVHPPKSSSPKILKDVLAEEVPQYKRYGRDYYINEAKKSAGCRKKSSYSDISSISSMNKSTSLDNFDTDFTSPGLLIKQFNLMASSQQFRPNLTSRATYSPNTEESLTTSAQNNNKDMISIEYEDANEQSLFSAKPVYVEDDTDEKFEEILRSAYKQPLEQLSNQVEEKNEKPNVNEESFLSSSSLDDSIKIYNVPLGEVVKNNAKDNVSTARYDSNECDKNANIDIPDKNVSGNSVLQSVSNKIDIQTRSVFSDVKMKEIKSSPKQIVINENGVHIPKVKDLAKKFVLKDHVDEEAAPRRRKASNDNVLDMINKSEKTVPNKQLYMHSLTARSISKEFRAELKLSMATPIKIPGGSNELPEGIEDISKESSRPGSPLPEPGTLKNKLAFFESLKAAFSSK